MKNHTVKTSPFIKMLRIDHWSKNVLIIPGVLFALSLTENQDIFDFERLNILKLFLGVVSICLASSANYLINEYLDRESDAFHPTKKHRIAANIKISKWKIVTLYSFITSSAILIAAYLGIQSLFTLVIYLLLAIFYNCKPIRLKDRVYFDVVTESANNPIRLLFGWFLISSIFYPPLTLIIAFWTLGIFLMGSKRLSEINQLRNKISEIEIANYRKSFSNYTFRNLSMLSNSAGLVTVLLLGVFSCKYKPEYLIFTIVVLAWITFYLSETYKEDSMVQAPEKLIKSKSNLVFALLILASYLIAQFLEIPFLNDLAKESNLKPGNFWASTKVNI